MKSKRFFTVKLLVFLFCLFYGAGVTPLFAQNFKQTLQWSADPNVLEYKVEIQDSNHRPFPRQRASICGLIWKEILSLVYKQDKDVVFLTHIHSLIYQSVFYIPDFGNNYWLI